MCNCNRMVDITQSVCDDNRMVDITESVCVIIEWLTLLSRFVL